jgi:hypothetical protein
MKRAIKPAMVRALNVASPSQQRAQKHTSYTPNSLQECSTATDGHDAHRILVAPDQET